MQFSWTNPNYPNPVPFIQDVVLQTVVSQTEINLKTKLKLSETRIPAGNRFTGKPAENMTLTFGVGC